MKTLKQSILSIAIGLALVAGISFAWTGAPGNPPNPNAPAPVNVGNSEQIKTGPLQVNGFRNVGNSVFDGTSTFKGTSNFNYVGIGTSKPTAKLHIKADSGNQAFRLQAGSIAPGNILTSDANGNAYWASPKVFGYEIKTANGYGTITAYCSVSKKILGGGCKYQNSSYEYTETSHIDSYPIMTGTNGWECESISTTFPTTVYAICAN